jgi:cytochrome c oxidase assembly protein Cox11
MLTGKKYSAKEVIFMLVVAMTAVSVLSYAAVTIPNSFTAGTTAKATDVNANFSYLAERSLDKSGYSLQYDYNYADGTTFAAGLILHNTNTSTTTIDRRISNATIKAKKKEDLTA